MTDLPVWVAAGSGLAQAIATSVQVYVGMRLSRQKAAEAFGNLLDELLDISPERIAKVLEAERVAELVGHAWEAAARSASEAKRGVLARVAAAALNGEIDEATVDPHLLLVRTVEAVDEPHLRLLLLIAEPRPGTGPLAGTRVGGSVRVAELEQAWPGGASLVLPMLAVLQREGLIEDRAVGTLRHQPAYSITAYGRELLRFLPTVEP